MAEPRVTLRDVYEVVNRVEQKVDDRMERVEARVAIVEGRVSNLEGKASLVSIFWSSLISLGAILVNIFLRQK